MAAILFDSVPEAYGLSISALDVATEIENLLTCSNRKPGAGFQTVVSLMLINLRDTNSFYLPWPSDRSKLFQPWTAEERATMFDAVVQCQIPSAIDRKTTISSIADPKKGGTKWTKLKNWQTDENLSFLMHSPPAEEFRLHGFLHTGENRTSRLFPKNPPMWIMSRICMHSRPNNLRSISKIIQQLPDSKILKDSVPWRFSSKRKTYDNLDLGVWRESRYLQVFGQKAAEPASSKSRRIELMIHGMKIIEIEAGTIASYQVQS